jgi:hypothetical protein
MTPEQKQRTEKFVGALRSGHYVQCFGAMEQNILETKDKAYCALGLALKLKEKLTNQNCEEWYGFPFTVTNHIMIMNDSGKSFDDIADYIQKKLS